MTRKASNEKVMNISVFFDLDLFMKQLLLSR